MRIERLALFLVLFFVAGQAAARKKKVDPRLASVQTVFVAGSNPAAANARNLISEWTCFRLVSNPQGANAVFEFGEQMSQDHSAPAASSNRAIVIATMTTRNGDLIWSKPASTHAAFMNTGGGSAARKVIFALQHDAFPHAQMTFGGVNRRSCPNHRAGRLARRRRGWKY